MTKRTKNRVLLAIVLIGGILVIQLLFGITFYYDQYEDNDPLIHPIAITKVTADRIILADGRALLPSENSKEWLETIAQQPDQRLELEPAENGFVKAYRKARISRDGSLYPMIRIPILPRHRIKNGTFGAGRWKVVPPPAEASQTPISPEAKATNQTPRP